MFKQEHLTGSESWSFQGVYIQYTKFQTKKKTNTYERNTSVHDINGLHIPVCISLHIQSKEKYCLSSTLKKKVITPLKVFPHFVTLRQQPSMVIDQHTLQQNCAAAEKRISMATSSTEDEAGRDILQKPKGRCMEYESQSTPLFCLTLCWLT